MGVLGWIIGAGVVGGLLHKSNEEARAKAAEEQRRKNTPCYFEDGFSEEEFESIIKRIEHQIKRLSSLRSDGPIVYGTVQSQSGISEWGFSIDYNDYGHITQRYWLSSDNTDSNIPENVARKILKEIDLIKDGAYCSEENACSNTGDNAHCFCPSCGKVNNIKNAKFCGYCGAKLK